MKSNLRCSAKPDIRNRPLENFSFGRFEILS
jgi:hypothetical protein